MTDIEAELIPEKFYPDPLYEPKCNQDLYLQISLSQLTELYSPT